jgi:NadR type nicotinamide-nucleotide adenylyltransferase
MPPHRGHQFLVDFARRYARTVTLFLVSTRRDPIAGKQREAWLRELFPGVRVIRLNFSRPIGAEPADPESASLLALRIQDRLRHLDFLFSSERRTATLADRLGARHVLVDPKRLSVPISATKIREAPMTHWDFIPPCIRPHFVKRVTLLGPEGTGKTTLAQQLAELYRTVVVGEYVRILQGLPDVTLGPAEIPLAARAQIASEDALARQANRVLICDTDLISLWLWAERRWGWAADWVVEQAHQRAADLFLVLATDGPSSGASAYDTTQKREAFLERCQEVLRSAGKRFVVLRGSWSDRLDVAERTVGELLQEKPDPSAEKV